jgi:hypothetical protein
MQPNSRRAKDQISDSRSSPLDARRDQAIQGHAFPDIHWQKIRTNNPRERAPIVVRFEMAITPADFQRLRHLLPGADQARLEAMSACGEEPGGGRWQATCSPPSARHHWPNDDDTSPNVASTFIRNPPCRDVDWPAMLSAATSAWSAASRWIALTKCAPVEKSSASGGTTKRRRPTLIQATSKF